MRSTVSVTKSFLIFLMEIYQGRRAIELIKRNSRRYAKRQMTWWSKDKEIKWFEPEQVGEIKEYIEESVKPTFSIS